MINIPSTLRISFRALKVNKMRSALTMLGIIIGVGAVIAMLAVGTGASKKIAEQISSMGSNLLIILPGATTAGGVRMGAGTQPTLTMGDAEAIQKECPAVQDVAPILNGVAQVVYGHQNWSTGVVGTTPGMLSVRDWSLASGRPFTQQDVKSATKVCLLGQTVVDNLFGDMDPVRQIIRIKKVPFTVIGVLTKKGQSAHGQDQDDTIYVPVTTAQKKLFGTTFPGMVRIMMVKAKSTEDLAPAEKQINELLRQRHHIGQKQENDFTVRNLTQIMETAEQSTKVMTLLLGAIASVSLLVGGIGIMNIMLVSVTERTREIGIRMAIGAKTWDIRLQFIIEALTLSLVGGIVGIIVGVSGSKILSVLAGWSTVISPFSILLAFGFSGLVGIFFGFYPAYKASLLDPIDALRYE
ncbi:MAG: multidrug ABC transporter substrate-binding protein [Nitrospirae bacterium CG_4_10_14_0_8_um_filter_41_23]|nr:MAG: multidrug ABC transporter substrate-binding protein [Nitrospirae bacterium CG2_30_41_42]PIQ94822.1 MAG: multidrug ABC transporter substrate-binding protein [Nitrospirae bacterium CG11_big_fil_rev_8_21_14_0_20_41_14]PIV43300.1 MAG: multidrug ABC transporter substrate-binding protein [Nitrospirae bacterium CG02_land_8_20_14_3_00_41_53]PIW87730.1 MAG: multidrug ABC transporter substrate-binding protein [Nitrospirae bacterium CG_4_8_14_3_um_filter_41_47]PIY86592.1 MAG: multidrug ABC transpo